MPLILGYAAYLVFLFVPGLGVGEFFGVWPAKAGLTSTLAYAFGLGLAVDTIAIFVRTSGVHLGSVWLGGLDVYSVYSLMLFGLALIGASFIRRKKLSFLVRPKSKDYAVLAIMAVQFALVYLWLLKYPIFPATPSQDFGVHTQTVEGLISGSVVTIPGGILYYGIHCQLASALLLVGGNPLPTVAWTMGLLVVLSPLLFYLFAEKLIPKGWAGVVVTSISTLSGIVWFDTVFNSGLYANFFGILVSLFLAATFLDVALTPPSKGSWLAYILAVGVAYISHYTTLALFGALLLFSIVRTSKNRYERKRHALATAVYLAPGIIGAVAFPGVVSKALSLATGGGGQVVGGTALSSFFSFLPVLSYMDGDALSDVAFLFYLIFAAFFLSRSLKSRESLSFLPLLWLLPLMVVAPLDVNAWRFALEAMVPLTIIASCGVYLLIPKVNPDKKKKAGQYSKTILVGVALIGLLVVGSWGTSSLQDSLTSPGATAHVQQSDLSAIDWLGTHTPNGSTYLTVSDWQFTYSLVIIGRETAAYYTSNGTAAVAAARQFGAEYLIATNLAMYPSTEPQQPYSWDAFVNSSSLHLVFRNDNVKIFGITNSTFTS